MEKYALFDDVYLDEFIDIQQRREAKPEARQTRIRELVSRLPANLSAAQWTSLLTGWTDEQLRAAGCLLTVMPHGNHPLHGEFAHALRNNPAGSVKDFFNSRVADVWRYKVWRRVIQGELSALLTAPGEEPTDLSPWTDEQLRAARAILIDFPNERKLQRWRTTLTQDPAHGLQILLADLELARLKERQTVRLQRWLRKHPGVIDDFQTRIRSLLTPTQILRWEQVVRPLLRVEDLIFLRERQDVFSDKELKTLLLSLLFLRNSEEEIRFRSEEECRWWLDFRLLKSSQLRELALQDNLIGLALSGGGIRSATYGLGALQALAEIGMLPAIDYQSTVSGGGYIGSWLASWILREQQNPKAVRPVDNVALQLVPSRKENAGATRGGSADSVPVKRVIDAEPEPIRHLRAYSNYLSPKLGIFSTDGWSLIATYLRNLFLNQLLFLFSMLAILFFVGFIIQLYATVPWVTNECPVAGHPWVAWIYVTLIALLVGVLCRAFVQVVRSLEVIPQGPPGDTVDNREARERRALFAKDFGVHLRILLPLLSGAGLLTLLALCSAEPVNLFMASLIHPESWPAVFWATWLQHPVKGSIWLALVFAALVGLSLWCRHVARTALSPPHYWRPKQSRLDLVLGWIVAGLFVPVWALALAAFVCFWNTTYHWVGIAALLALVHASFNLRSWFYLEGAPKYSFIGIISGLVPGFLGGAAVCWLMNWCADLIQQTDESAATIAAHFPLVIVLGPPLFLIIFVLMETLQIGIEGKLMSDHRREWWASFLGLVLFYAVAWTVVFGITIFGTSAVYLAQGQDWHVSPTQATVFFAWAALVYAGLRSSYGSQTGVQAHPSTYRSSLRDNLARIAPLVFLVGYYLLLCVAANWLVNWHSFPDYEIYFRTLANPLGPEFLDRCPIFNCVPNPYTPFRPFWLLFLLFCVAVWLAFNLGSRVDVNLFSLQGLYAQRLVRAYMGASRPKNRLTGARGSSAPCASEPPPRVSHPLTGFDPDDDIELHRFQLRPGPASSDEKPYAGPCLLINTTLNLTAGPELAWQERKAESFVFTPNYCGSISTGFRPTLEYAAKLKKLTVGAAVGISGAAVSPNMGYHSSPTVAAFLTIFNARLGAWVGNPRSDDSWLFPGPRHGLLYLFKEALGRTDARDEYVYLSDGGHFDNLGVYELIRRRCRFIICTDGSADPGYSFFDLAMTIRKVRIDFGVRIDIDLSALRPQGPQNRPLRHLAIGKIFYKDVDGPPAGCSGHDRMHRFVVSQKAYRHVGLLFYVKPCLTGDETPDIANYAAENPAFPHESTVDQFYTESQFESYRALGYHCMRDVFHHCQTATPHTHNPLDLFQRAFNYWCSLPAELTGVFLNANNVYIEIQKRLGSDPLLSRFQEELAAVSRLLRESLTDAELLAVIPDEGVLRQSGLLPKPAHPPKEWFERAAGELCRRMPASRPWQTQAERAMVAQMLTFMENTYYGLKLEDYLDHPVNDGWRAAFCRWVSMPTFQKHATELAAEFSGPFNTFLEQLYCRPT